MESIHESLNSAQILPVIENDWTDERGTEKQIVNCKNRHSNKMQLIKYILRTCNKYIIVVSKEIII